MMAAKQLDTSTGYDDEQTSAKVPATNDICSYRSQPEGSEADQRATADEREQRVDTVLRASADRVRSNTNRTLRRQGRGIVAGTAAMSLNVADRPATATYASASIDFALRSGNSDVWIL